MVHKFSIILRWDHFCPSFRHDVVESSQGETSMANGVVVQIAFVSALAAISICLLLAYKRRKERRAPSHTIVRTRPVAVHAEKFESRPTSLVEVQRQATLQVTMETASAGNLAPTNSVASISSPSEPVRPLEVLQAQPAPESHNQKILAGISENIRKSVIKPVPTYSSIPQTQTPRDPEYVRVKKKILTPHGEVRFSILKDSISVNMLAVFRRACLEWKTPHDLIAFLPPYLEPEAEIFNGQLLLIGTSGHNEKLAIPIRSTNLDSNVIDCFDFVTDDRLATNVPAVLLVSDEEIEIVSRGVITQPVFLKPERGHEITFLVERYPEALQNG